MIWILVVLMTVLRPGDHWNGAWFGRWGILLTGYSALFSVWIWKRLHWSLGLLSFAFLLSTLQRFAWPFQLGEMPLFQMIEVQRGCAIAAFCFCLSMLYAALASRRELDRAIKALGWLGLANGALIIFQRLLIPEYWRWSGLIGQPSMSACLTAILLPFAPLRYGWAISAAGVLAGQTSMGLGTLVVVAATLLWRKGHGKRVALAAVVGAFAVAWLLQGKKELFSTSGRLQAWDLALFWWNAHQDSWRFPWIGAGIGSLMTLFPAVQKSAGFTAYDDFLMLHSDWVELLIGGGRLGLASGLLAYGSTLWESRRKPELLAAIAGYGACALGDYPNHAPFHALTGAVLAGLAFYDRRQPTTLS